MKKLTSKQSAELKRLAAMRDEDVDTSDIPEVVDWTGAVRGRFYRPIKQAVTIRLDADVLEWFKSDGDRYQTRINQVLRGYMDQQRGTEVREKLEKLGISEADVEYAVRWARRKKAPARR